MKSIIILMLALSLSACGTIGGMGEDVTEAAEWCKKKIAKTIK